MLSCEQLPNLLQQDLHNFRVARTTEHSDFDYLVNVFSGGLAQIALRRQAIETS